jgi:dipeptidyl aminopeptidase/acylaminoacyl peptidase
LCLVSSLAPAPASAAARRAFTIEDLYRLKIPSDPRISPDGRRVVYSVRETDLKTATSRTNLWIADLTTGAATPLTKASSTNGSPRWSPDGRLIAFVSNRGGDDQIWTVASSGGEPRLAAQLPAALPPAWSPDGSALLFATDVYPECGADPGCNRRTKEAREASPLRAHVTDRLLYRHWTEWKDGRRTHVVLAELASGKTTDLTPGDFDSPPFDVGGEVNYAFSPDGREVCFASNHDPSPESSTNSDLWVLPLSAGEARNVTAGNRGYDGRPEYSPDGRYIAYVTQRTPAYESDRIRLALYDRRSGTSKSLTDSFDNWVGDFSWARDSKSIFFTAQVGGESPLYRVDVATGAIAQIAAAGTIDRFDVAPDGRRAVVARRRVGEPHALWTVEIPGGAWKRVTHENEAVEREVDIRPAEKMTVPGADGHPVQVFLVKPHDFDPAKKYPLILNIHGGPQMQWEDSFRGDWQVYPGAGYVVAFPNPHGSTGFGQEYTAQISGDWGGKVMEDIDRVADALAELPFVDRERMGAMGWSWGGYAMMWLEGHTKRYKALASMMGLYDLRAFYGATEEMWFPEWDLKGAPGRSSDYEKFSPSNYASSFSTPCLVVTGERDYRVPYTQSLEFFTDLQKRGVPSRLIVFERSGHWPRWYDMVLYYTAHLEWFHRWLGGGGPPWSVDKLLRHEAFK